MPRTVETADQVKQPRHRTGIKIVPLPLTSVPIFPEGLLGPSGCGRSTLARISALLHRPGAGTRLLDGEPVHHWRHRAPRAQRTAVGGVFQQPRLFRGPRLRLTDLIAGPLRANGRRAEAPDPVAELAPTVGLAPGLPTRRPHEVSDGQLQRVCLARAPAR